MAKVYANDPQESRYQKTRKTFHDDGAEMVSKQRYDDVKKRQRNPKKFTGKLYMPVIPQYQKGVEIIGKSGMSTSKTTPDTITTYTGKEIRQRNQDKKLKT